MNLVRPAEAGAAAPLTEEALAQLPGIRHAFLTRNGGVSEGIYASLNCGFGSGDDPARVAENRARALAYAGLPPNALVTLYQVHSARVQTVDEVWAPGESPKIDGAVTDRPGIALGILSADCAPVLLADAEARVIGAAHAGWRGAVGGVLAATVEAMTRLGARPDRMRAAVGPCIAQSSYEVGPEFPAPFVAADPTNTAFFKAGARPGHFLFDLAGYVAARLAALGLAEVQTIGRDTCAEETLFFSYRRATLRGEPDYGRLLSIVCLEA